MYYQQQQVPLKIDVLNKDSICVRIFSWVLFYLFLQIFAIGDKKRLLQQLFFPPQCDEIITDNQTILTCVSSGIVNSLAQEMQLEVNISISTGDIYESTRQALVQEFSIYDIESNLLVKGNETLPNFSNRAEISNYTDVVIYDNLKLKLQCYKNTDHYNCLSSLREFKTHHQNFLCAQIKIVKPPQYKTMKISLLSAFYESKAYYQFLLIFQVISLGYLQFLFTIFLIYAIYYYFISVEGYHQTIRPLILQWMPYLLGLLIFYNLPIQILRDSNQYFVSLYFNIIELLVQTTLFYFWLKIFEFQQLQNMTIEQVISNKHLKIKNVLKLITVILYTVPQTLMNIYVFYQKQNLQQFDPTRDLSYYQSYQELILISLFLYTITYLYLLQKQFFYKQTEGSGTNNLQVKQYEIFDEQEQEKKIGAEMKSYKLLHILSTICFAVLIYNQYMRSFKPKLFSMQNTFNEWGLINIYIFIIIQLYVPHKINENIYTFEQRSDNRIKPSEIADAI